MFIFSLLTFYNARQTKASAKFWYKSYLVIKSVESLIYMHFFATLSVRSFNEVWLLVYETMKERNKHRYQIGKWCSNKKQIPTKHSYETIYSYLFLIFTIIILLFNFIRKFKSIHEKKKIKMTQKIQLYYISLITRIPNNLKWLLTIGFPMVLSININAN